MWSYKNKCFLIKSALKKNRIRKKIIMRALNFKKEFRALFK